MSSSEQHREKLERGGGADEERTRSGGAAAIAHIIRSNGGIYKRQKFATVWRVFLRIPACANSQR